jgi:hypothetical protein
MINIRNLALGLALMLAATGAEAQSDAVAVTRDEVQVVVRQDEGLERRMTLARELIGLSAGPNFAKEFERAMIDQMGKIDEQGGEESVWVRANMPPMLTRMAARLLDDLAPAYATIYTEEELRGQIDFYRSPVGRSVAAKAISLGVAAQEAQTTAMTSLFTEFQAKYCARFDCGESPTQSAAKPRR